jgi:hypothetical protein
MSLPPSYRDGPAADQANSLVHGTSALALHTPEPLLTWPVPMPLFLVAYVPASFKRSYVTTADGLVDSADSRASFQYALADGSQFQVDVQGDQAHGLPNQWDMDYLLALFSLADHGFVNLETGEVHASRRSLRALLRAACKDEEGGKAGEAVKTFLRRWGGVHVTTRARIDYGPEAAEVQGGGMPVVVSGRVDRRERETTHFVLEYEFERLTIGGHTTDTLTRLRINPVWLSQNVAGVSAWLDVATHNGLNSVWAKRIYQVLAAHAAQETTLPWTLRMSMPAFLDLLGVRDRSRPLAKQAELITAACRSLVAVGVLREGGTELLKGTRRSATGSQYFVTLVPGATLIGLGLFRGVSTRDSDETRLYLTHLRAYGFRPAEARALLASDPARVRTMLRRAVFEQVVRSKQMTSSWAGWLRTGVKEGWQFDQDPEFIEWVAEQERAARTGRTPATPPGRETSAIQLYELRGRRKVTATAAGVPVDAPAPESPEVANAPLELPATLWGRVLSRMRALPAPEGGDASVRMWLLPTVVADDLVDGVRMLQLTPPDAMAEDWIRHKLASSLARCATDEAGGPVVLRLGDRPLL